MSDQEISNLQAQVDCYLSSINQLKKDIPIYFKQHSEINKETLILSKVLRSVGTLEINKQIQDAYFLCANKYEALENEKHIYDDAYKHITDILDNSRNKIILPTNEIINDILSKRKKQHALLTQYKQSKKPLIESDYQAIDEMNQLVSYTQQTFPLNAFLHEKYRQETMRKLLYVILQTEIRHHCVVIEELSEVLQQLDYNPSFTQKT